MKIFVKGDGSEADVEDLFEDHGPVDLEFPCFHCSVTIDTKHEPCYTLAYDPSVEDMRNKKDKNITVFFHLACWKEVGGKRYTLK